MTNRLGYFTLDTPDIDKARVFYSALFGWTFSEIASGHSVTVSQDQGVSFALWQPATDF